MAALPTAEDVNQVVEPEVIVAENGAIGNAQGINAGDDARIQRNFLKTRRYIEKKKLLSEYLKHRKMVQQLKVAIALNPHPSVRNAQLNMRLAVCEMKVSNMERNNFLGGPRQ